MKLRITPRAWLPWAVAGMALTAYCCSMAPTVSYIDSGELAAVASTLGIAHPSGYPLFTLLGWLFTQIPWPGEEINRLNVMSAIFCAAGVLMFYYLIETLLRILTERGGKRIAWLASSGGFFVPVAAGGASAIVGFSETWWTQAVSVEVYSLHVLCLVTTIYSFLRANESGESGWWLLFGFLVGLGFTNHMTMILLAPGFLYYYFANQGWKSGSWLRLARIGSLFLLGLSVYLYLPIRAAQGPHLSWGNPVTWERFVWHLSGKQYRVWMFSSTEASGRQLRYFLDSLPGEFAYVGLFFAVIGCVLLFRTHRRLWLWSLALFVTCVMYAINYDIHDIDSYFLLAYVVVALWAGVGVWGTGAWMVHGWEWKRSVVAGVLCALCMVPLALNFARVDQRSAYDVEDYTRNMFASLDTNALVFSYQWDFWVSASQYYQLVRGIRRDVTVVDKELLRRSWYFSQLEKTSGSLISSSRVEVDAFLRELYKFEHELPYNGDVIESRFVEMIRAFIRRSALIRPVFVTSEIEQEFTQGFQRVPVGLAFRLVADSSFHSTPFPLFSVRPIKREGRLEIALKRLYCEAFLARGEYYLRQGEQIEAIRCYQEALRHNPTSLPARMRLQSMGRFR